MGAINIPASAFRDAHGYLTDAADQLEDWPVTTPTLVTDEEIERFIADLDASGMYDDELGCPKTAPSLFKAVARQWVLDKEAVGEIIGPSFWAWARAAARLAKFGK